MLRSVVRSTAPDMPRRRGIVRDVDIELAFHREENVDPVQRINAQLFEGAVGRHLFLGKVLGRGDDSSDALGRQ